MNLNLNPPKVKDRDWVIKGMQTSMQTSSMCTNVIACMALNIWYRRLVRNIRTAEDISSTGVLQREWDIRLEDQDTLFRDDLREASGIGKRKIKQVKLFLFECILLYT